MLEVLESVCSSVLILYKGRVVADDSVDRLRELMSQPSLEAIFAQLNARGRSPAVASRIVEAMRA